MNKYLINLNKIEFVITNACTGKCKHCSEGDHSVCAERIDPEIAADSVRKIASEQCLHLPVQALVITNSILLRFIRYLFIHHAPLF